MTPDLSLTSFRLAIPDHAIGLPVLRALSLCACCRQYPGTATDGTSLLIHSVVSAFPRRAAGSACASSFSRLTQRSLTLRPAHSRCHQNLWPAIRRLQSFRFLRDCSGCFRLEHFAGWGFHPLESAAFARRTPELPFDIPDQVTRLLANARRGVYASSGGIDEKEPTCACVYFR